MGLPAAQPERSAVHTRSCHWSRAATTLLARPVSESCFWKVLPPKAALLLKFLTELGNVHHDATNAPQRQPCRVCQKVKASPVRGGRGWTVTATERRGGEGSKAGAACTLGWGVLRVGGKAAQGRESKKRRQWETTCGPNCPVGAAGSRLSGALSRCPRKCRDPGAAQSPPRRAWPHRPGG